ncbi:competence protein ComK [Aeribacillus kexueae]|uniref:competence protein ComK n=1 Tax=Aeribacillus kexueae TaxID=2078952 RepID=UPI001FAF0DBE|nr:competence protein ComK [Bacillus kexueae]
MIQVNVGEMITEETLAVLPTYSETGHLHSNVLTLSGDKILEKPPLHFIKESCTFYGGDFKGKVNHARSVLKGKRMLPILISETFAYCMLPVGTIMDKASAWIAYNHVDSVISHGERSMVVFRNKREVVVNMRKAPLERQLYKGARLISTHLIREKLAMMQNQVNKAADGKGYYIYFVPPHEKIN